MAKTKLKEALDRHKGRNHALEKQRKLEKAAKKRKSSKKSQQVSEAEEGDQEVDETETVVPQTNGNDAPEWETEDEEEDTNTTRIDASRLADSDSDSDGSDDEEGVTTNGFHDALQEPADEEEEEEEEGDEDIPLSDLDSLASEDKGDIVPHQRLTINNTTALTAALKRISLPTSTVSFSVHQTLSTTEPVSIPDIDDDLNRELAFYKQSLDAAREARALLKKEGVPFTRPTDYFAEMVKSDEHMGRVRQKMVDTAAGKRAAADARKQRDLKKFGKAVQVEKQRERAKEKRETLERINTLKRKRAGADLTATNEEDLFDIALDDAAGHEKEATRQRRANGAAGGGSGSSNGRSAGGKPSAKRQKRDERFGFGGKKRYAKSGDAISSADMRGFSTKRMKADAYGSAAASSSSSSKGPRGAKRPGKSRRAKMK